MIFCGQANPAFQNVNIAECEATNRVIESRRRFFTTLAISSSGLFQLREENSIKKSLYQSQWKIVLPSLLLLLVGLALILFDRDRIIQILAQANWKVLPGALLFVILSNSLVSVSYVILARALGISIPRFELGLIFYVTNVLNRLVRSGGAAGFSLRYLLMKPYGVELNDVLNSSFIHFLLGGLIMLGALPVVVIYTLLTLPVSEGLFYVLIFLALFGVFAGIGVVLAVFSDRFRSSIGRIIIWLAEKITRREYSSRINAYSQRAALAVSTLRQDWRRVSLVMLLLLGEWSTNVILLNYCMEAFGPALSLSGAAVIYVVSTTAGVVTAWPGGVGIQEGMITSLAVLQGSSFEQAVLAAILYRILLTFLPYLLSFLLYPYLLKASFAIDTPSE